MSGIPRRAIEDGAISPGKLNAVLKDGKYFYANGHELAPIVSFNDPSVAMVVGTDTTATILYGDCPVSFRTVAAVGHSSEGPVKAAGGESVDIFQQAATGQGYEYSFVSFPETVTGHDASEPFVYTVGSSAPLKIRLKCVLPNVSGIQDLYVGFRNGVASPTSFDNFTDAAAVAVDLGDVFVKTILNNAATVETDSGEDWADTEEHEVQVVVGLPSNGFTGNGAGVARFFLDGAEIGAPFTFDTGDEIFPFVFINNNQTTGEAGGALLTELEVAYLADVDDYYVN